MSNKDMSREERLRLAEETGHLLREEYEEADRLDAPILAPADALWDKLLSEDDSDGDMEEED